MKCMPGYLKNFLPLMVALLFSQALQSQYLGFHFKDRFDKSVIKFETRNSLIIIPILINDRLRLKFILDTGVQTAIITEKLLAQATGLSFDRKISIGGPGREDSIFAHVVNRVNLKLSNEVFSSNSSILVLENDFLELENSLGEEIYGIIGYDIFSRFIVEIDYDRSQITLRRPRKSKKRKYRGYYPVPLDVDGTKPYLKAKVIQNNDTVDVRLMVDSGASHSILISQESNEKLSVPEKSINTLLGRGLGGEIFGEIGRLNSFIIGKFCFEDVLGSFPNRDDYSNKILRGSRDGTLGSDILRRFNCVFNYSDEVLYIRKNRNFRDDFEYDMSGMEVNVKGKALDQYFIYNLREASPAKEAGIMVGDIIKKINGNHAEQRGLNNINELLKRRPGKKIKLKIQRGDSTFKVKFRLRRAI